MKCTLMNKNTEFVIAYQIRNDMVRHDNKLDYEEYIKELEKNGIENSREKMENI